MTLKIWKFIIGETEQKMRLDQIISTHTGLSRRKVRSIMQVGGVQISKKRTRIASKKVALNDEIVVAYDNTLIKPVDIKIPIIFEDEWLLVIDKPSGITVQGTQASDKHDLMAILSKQYPNYQLKLQHRLDQGTSGILVVSKTSLANIGYQLKERLVEKKYIVRTSKPIKSCTVDFSIGKVNNLYPSRYACVGNLTNIKEACTKFTFLDECNEYLKKLKPGFWAIAKPITGRTHQIRVHLAHINNPVYGDIFYGGEPSDQLWLHAWKLNFIHPITNTSMELIAQPNRFFI